MAHDFSNCAGLAALKLGVNASTERKRAIAERAGITRQHLAYILAGGGPSTELQIRLAEMFGFRAALWLEEYRGPGTVADIELRDDPDGRPPLGGEDVGGHTRARNGIATKWATTKSGPLPKTPSGSSTAPPITSSPPSRRSTKATGRKPRSGSRSASTP